jgi:crotonobetainyl-CoA:carnitine CoA-transferase CaiB-like acyl-CoA transferase
MNNGPLSGIRVIELGTHVAVPSSCRLMAEYGADVIKIETASGDPWRYSGLVVNLTIDDFSCPVFTIQNNGKRLISLDLKTEHGHDVMMKLLKSADIFCTNVRMKGLTKLGLDYDSLKEKFPRLIYTHLTGYGHRGPDAEAPGFDVASFWSRVGARISWVEKGSFPLRAAGGYGDMVTGLLLFAGMTTALIGREKTGKGTFISNSLYGTSMWVNAQSIMCAQAPYNHEFPEDVDRPGSPVVNDYICKDGEWLALVGIGYEKNFPRYCRALGIEDEIDDPRCKNEKVLADSDHIYDLTKKVAEKMKTKTSDEWEKIFRESDLVYSRLNHYEDVAKDKQAWDNDYLQKITWGNGISNAVPRPPLHLSGYEQRETTPLGGIGQHTDAVLLQLGYTQEEIDAMRLEKSIK